MVAPSAPALQASLAGAAAAARGARAAFDRRFAGLPASSARVAFDPRALLAARSPAVARTRVGPVAARRAPRCSSFAVTVSSLPFEVSADPAGLSPASCRSPPVPAPRGPRAAARSSPRSAHRRRRSRSCAPPACSALDVLNRAPGFLRPDLSDLGPQATIVAADQQNPDGAYDPAGSRRLVDQAEAPGRALRADPLRRAGRRADRPGTGGAYTIESDGELAGRVGVYGPVVVFSTDPRADLQDAARAPAVAPVPGAAGALTVRLAPSLFGALLPAIARGHIADVTGWARAELSSLQGELAVRVR